MTDYDKNLSDSVIVVDSSVVKLTGITLFDSVVIQDDYNNSIKGLLLNDSISISDSISEVFYPTGFLVNFLSFKGVIETLKLSITITITEDFDYSLLDNLSDIVNKTKAAGVYYDSELGYNLLSQDDIFLINFSEYNGKDKIL